MSSDDHIELQWIKRILIGCIGALAAHFAAGIWWAATITTDMKYLRIGQEEMRTQLLTGATDRYRGADAARDLQVVKERFDRNESRLSKIEEFLRVPRGGVNG